MGKLPAALLCAAIPVSFALGAWAQDSRMRDHYRSQGRIEAYKNIQRDGLKAYLTCIDGNCEAERETQIFVAAIAEARIHEEPTP